jgi:esterase/lipase superfamily enzyme
MEGIYERFPSEAMGRDMHVWRYGWWGAPVLVFPSAAGFAHEWQKEGMIDTLEPLLHAGKIKLYCPESNVAEAFTRDGDPAVKMAAHERYERFILQTMVPFIRRDCNLPNGRIGTVGCSLGGLYAALFSLKHPQTFDYALCMSGRYEITQFLKGHNSPTVYFNNPLAFVPNLQGEALEATRRTHLAMVCGTGQWEEGCIEETIALCDVFQQKGIPHQRDIWGQDSKHHWSWWKKQCFFHLSRAYGR